MAQEYDDTEYQFNEGEEGEVIEGQEKSPVYEDVEKKPSKGSIKNIVILIIMAIISVLIVYKVFSLMFGDTETKADESVPEIARPTEEEPKEIVMDEKIDQVKEEVVPEEKMEKVEEVVQPESEAIPSVDHEVEQKDTRISDKFRSSIDAIDKQISEIQEGNKNLVAELKSHESVTSDRLVSLEQTVDSLKTSINSLQMILKGLSSQLNRVESQAKLSRIQQIKAEKAMEKEVRAKKRYFVEAVIPGRAWIRSMDGSAFTVSIGDQIAGYGKVVSINSYSGTVTTSSGGEIYYGIN